MYGGFIGCAMLRSLRIERCSEAIVPYLSQVVEFCRARPALRHIAVVRIGGDQWQCSAANTGKRDGDGACDSGDPFECMLGSCSSLESLELSAADAWPRDNLVRLMQTGGRDSTVAARIQRLTIHDTGALAHKPSHKGTTGTEQSSWRSAGHRSATISSSPTVYYDATLARVNASAAVGVTRELFFGPS